MVAWAAGFFEGEGYFTFHTDKRRPHLPGRPFVGLLNSNLGMLRRFHEIVGVGHISGPRRRFVNKPMYTWQATGEKDVRSVYAMFARYLSEERCTQAECIFRKTAISVQLITQTKGDKCAIWQ